MDDLDDEGNKKCIIIAFDLIESFVQFGRDQMGPGGRPDLVTSALKQIEFSAQGGREFRWPDPQARALEAARRDRALQKALKKAHRKTPI